MKKDRFMIKSMDERVIYNPENPSEILDWMGYEINEENPICFVEIVGEKKETEGVALLSNDSHRILQKIKAQDEDLYDNWLISFSITDRRLIDSNPDDSLWNMISELHAQTEMFVEEHNTNRKR